MNVFTIRETEQVHLRPPSVQNTVTLEQIRGEVERGVRLSSRERGTLQCTPGCVTDADLIIIRVLLGQLSGDLKRRLNPLT
jgi:hypothetical protein